MNPGSFSVRLRVADGPRQPAWPTGDDDALGQAVLARLLDRIARGPVRPALLLFWADRVQVLDLVPLLRKGGDTHRLIAALAGQEGIEAVAVAGPMVRRHRSQVVERTAGVFVEWTDGRWWGTFRPLTDEGRLMPTDSHDVLRAVDGLPRPGGLGAWFSRARFQGLRAEVRPTEAPPVASEVVN